MNTQPVGPAYHQSLENLLTLWGYEIAWKHAGQIQVFKSGQAHLGYLTAGFAGYDFWTLETWVNNIKARDAHLLAQEEAAREAPAMIKKLDKLIKRWAA